MNSPFSLLMLLVFSFISICKISAEEPAAYIQNNGQWENHILFKAEISGGYLFAEQNKITFVMSESDKIHHVSEDKSITILDEVVLGRFSYQVEFLDANVATKAVGQTKMPSYHNYFTSSDQSKWRSEVPLFEQVFYPNFYPNIDLVLKSKDRLFEYDFIIHPGADISKIKMKYNGVDAPQIRDGQLHFNTPMGKVVELAPIVYQENEGLNQAIKTNFVKHSDGSIGFKVVDDYNTSKSLIIDPILVFSTYTGSTADNWGFSATYDLDGNLYAGGMVSGQGYPTTLGAYDTIYAGGESNTQTDIGVSKFSDDGTQLLYSTYIGGSNNEIPHSLIVNEKNELIIYGSTGSFDYPTTLNAYDKTFNGGTTAITAANINYLSGSDIVVTKLNVNGSNLIGSTFFGGTDNDGLNNSGNLSLEYNYGDFARGDVTIGPSGDIYISSCSYSDDLPVDGNSFQSTKDSSLSAVVARFSDDLSTLRWATYIGGDGDDAAYSIEVTGNEVIIAGGTGSENFPVSSSAYQPIYGGGQSDGYILKLNTDGTASTGATYVGTEEYDQVYFLEIDELNDVYVFGQTLGDYPVSSDVYSVNNSTQFIHKLNNSLNQSVYSTVYGSQHLDGQTRRVNISPTAFLVDNCTNIYAIGWGGNVNNGHNGLTGNTNNLFLTADAFQTGTDGSDFYFIVLENDATNVQYATYFGELGGTGDHVDGGTSRFDKNGIVYHASCASCGQSNGFPVTDGAWSENNLGANCNMAAYKFRFEQAAINAVFDADPFSGCPPLEVQFENFSSIDGDAYFWDFDDGSTSTLENPQHTFTDLGVYNVQFVIIDSSNCLVADTAYVEITVSGGTDVAADFIVSDSICSNTNIALENLSTNASNFLWDFGDGNTSTLENPIHTYTIAGVFTITLIADPGSACSDTATLELEVFENVLEVSFDFSQADCNDTTGTVSFTETINAQNGLSSLLWDFGDGSTSTQQSPIHAFETGNYIVNLLVEDNVGCTNSFSNTVDVSTDTLSVDFDYTATCNPLLNGMTFNATVETNTNIVEYEWDFGDGLIAIASSNPQHFYSSEGTYEVTVTVTNDLGCTASKTQTVVIQIEELNANFTVETGECGETTIQFINTTSPTDSIIGYLWDFGNGDTSTAQSPNYTYPQVGSYFVSLTAFSSSGCQSSVNQFIQMPQLEVQIVVGAIPICNAVNVPIQFGITGNSSSSLTQFDWDFGDGTTALNTFNILHSFSDTGTYVVQYFISNLDGCADTISQEVVIRAGLDVEIIPTRDDCSATDLSVDFDIATPDINLITDVSWDFGDGSTLTDSINLTHTYSTAGTYTVILNVESSLGCAGIDTIEITVEPISVDAQFSLETSGCPSREIHFINESSASETITSYSWDFGDGGNSIDSDPVYEYSAIGNYDVILVTTTVSGCVDSFTLNIDVIEVESEASFETSIGCDTNNLEVTFTDLSTSDTTIVSWQWSFGDNSSAIEQNPIHVYTLEGTYSVELVIENSVGCIDTITQDVEVDVPVLNAEFSSDTLICSGSTVNFTNTTNSEVTVDAWSWTFGDGNSSDQQTPSNTYTTEGTYEVMLIVSAAGGCVDTAELSITVAEAQGVSLVDSVFMCEGTSVELPLQGNSNQTYNWQPNQFLDDNTLEQPTANPSVNTFYSLTVEETLANGNTCSLTDGVWVIVNDVPTVEATANPSTVLEGATSTLDATDGLTSYSWSPADDLSNPNIENPIATVFEETTFYVTGVDANGCSNIDSVTIEIIEDESCPFETLYIPNAFTPNKDGQNDILYVRMQGEIDRMDFRIYNRWGEEVFVTDDLSRGWDGTYDGEYQSTDVFGYYLEIECNQEIITKQGNITLVR